MIPVEVGERSYMNTPRVPTNEEIEAVMNLTATSSDQFYDRLRDLFAGHDYFSQPRTPIQTLEEMEQEVFEVNTANGWFDADRTFGDDIALLHTEVSEMFEAYRDHQFEDATVEPLIDPEKIHELSGGVTKLPKPEGVGSEAADVFIRLLDTCRRRGINLRAEYVRKIAFNRTRGYKHGGRSI